MGNVQNAQSHKDFTVTISLLPGLQQSLTDKNNDGGELEAPVDFVASQELIALQELVAPKEQGASLMPKAPLATPPAPVKVQSNYVLINTKKKNTAEAVKKITDPKKTITDAVKKATIPTPIIAKRTVSPTTSSVKPSERQKPVTTTKTTSTTTTTTTTAPTTATTVDSVGVGGEDGSAVLAAAGTPEDADAAEVYCDATPDYNLLRNGLGSTGTNVCSHNCTHIMFHFVAGNKVMRS